MVGNDRDGLSPAPGTRVRRAGQGLAYLLRTSDRRVPVEGVDAGNRPDHVGVGSCRAISVGSGDLDSQILRASRGGVREGSSAGDVRPAARARGRFLPLVGVGVDASGPVASGRDVGGAGGTRVRSYLWGDIVDGGGRHRGRTNPCESKQEGRSAEGNLHGSTATTADDGFPAASQCGSPWILVRLVC